MTDPTSVANISETTISQIPLILTALATLVAALAAAIVSVINGVRASRHNEKSDERGAVIVAKVQESVAQNVVLDAKADANAAKTDEIHAMVNDNTAKLIDEVTALKAELAAKK